MKKSISIFVAICIIMSLGGISLPAYAADEIILEHDTDKINVLEYSEANLGPSGMKGIDISSPGSRCSGAQNAWGKWDLSKIPTGEYEVYVYKVVRPEDIGGNDNNILVTVSHNSEKATFHYDQKGASEWVKVGTYCFQGMEGEFIEMKKTTPTGELAADGKSKTMQVDSIKLIKVGDFKGQPAKTPEPNTVSKPNVYEKAKVTEIKIIDGVIDVDNCGAKPNSKIDSGDVIRAVVAKAVEATNVTVKFSEGTYILSPANDTPLIGGYYFTIDGSENITFEGNNTIFMFTDQYCGGIMTKNSKNITYKNIILDYEKLPISQGEVVGVNKETGTFDYKIMNGYDTILDARMTQIMSSAFGVVLQKDNPYLQKPSAPNFFRINGISKVKDNIYKISLQDPYKSYVVNESQIAVGDKISINNRGVIGTAFRVENCHNPSIIDCKIYATPGTGVTATYYTGEFNINGLQLIKRPNSANWLVSGADGIHIQGGRGPLLVENCIFEGMMDDGVNIYQYPSIVNQVISNKELLVSHTSGKTPLEGDTVAVLSIKTGQYKGKAKVLSVVKNEKNATITLDTPIDGMETGTAYTDADLIYVDDVKFPGTVFKNNIFRESRRYGIMFRTLDVTIENNQFTNLGGAGILSYTGPDGEGPGVENTKIINNTFTNCGFIDQDFHSTYGAPIKFVSVKSGNIAFAEPNNFNAEITGNTIIGTNRYGIAITATDGVKITNNTIIVDKNQNISNGNISGIFIDTSKNIEITGNNITDPRKELKAGIELTNNNSLLQVADNKLNLADGVTAVLNNVDNEIVSDYFAVKAPQMRIDGKMDEWKDALPIKLDQFDMVKNFKTLWTKEDISGESYIMWDENNFYMFAVVKDNIHHQTNDASNLWKADSIQIAFDTARDTKAGSNGYTEITLGVTNDHTALYHSYKSIPKTNSQSDENVLIVSVRDENVKTTTYEIQIPWTEIFDGKVDVKENKQLGFSMLINDSDGDARKGWIEYCSGIGTGKDPLSYGNLTLVIDAPITQMEFIDMDDNLSWAKDAIYSLAGKGIISGKGDGKFAPYDTISRAEFIKLIIGILDLSPSGYILSFEDVENDAWYSGYIQAAMDASLFDTAMLTDNKAKPDDPITREEMTSFIVNAYEFKTGKQAAKGTQEFDDHSKIASWAKSYVEKAVELGVIKGVGDNRFAPKDTANRAQGATMIYRLLTILDK